MTPAPFATSPILAVNVACVPQRSPLRYPGGKTWLIPHVRHWLSGQTVAVASGDLPTSEPSGMVDRQRLPGLSDPSVHPPAAGPRRRTKPRLLLEPFAGGGIVSLTAVMEGLVERCLLAELDGDVAAFWQAALRHGPALQARVRQFEPTRDAVVALASTVPTGVLDRGFRTLVLNRTRRGGILAPGASLSRRGENGKGVGSRWYPATTVRRLAEIERHSSRIDFRETDGLELLASLLHGLHGLHGVDALSEEPMRGLRASAETVVFVDPPYTAGGKRAGARLYRHNELDHARLFDTLASSNVEFLMTYDCSPEVVRLIEKHGFHAVRVATKNTHHAKLPELVVTRRNVFGNVPAELTRKAA